MFKRTDSNPGEFNPTRSTIALAVTLLVSLGLAQWYVSTKQGTSNTRKLLTSLRENGLDKFVSYQPYSQYYILYNNDVPVGYRYYEHFWRDNYLVGVEITQMPEQAYYGISEWKISNNTNTWSQHERINANGTRSALDINYNPDEGMKYILNGTYIDTSSLSLRSNIIPPFMLDIYSSIGIQQYNSQLDLLLLAGIKVISFAAEPGDSNSIPMQYKSNAPDGITVKTSFRNISQQLYYNKDHQLIYQKDNADRQYNTIIASEDEEVFRLWPEAEKLIPENNLDGQL